MIKTGKYIVNLVHGNITELSECSYNNIEHRYQKHCYSLLEAEAYSLNVLRQNFQEYLVKTGQKSDPFKKMARMVLGECVTVQACDIVPRLKEMKNLYPEFFI